MIPPRIALPVKGILSRSAKYVRLLSADPVLASARGKCRNNHVECSQWALGTGCDDNPEYMKRECGPACRSCDYASEMKSDCAPDPEGKDAVEAG